MSELRDGEFLMDIYLTASQRATLRLYTDKMNAICPLDAPNQARWDEVDAIRSLLTGAIEQERKRFMDAISES
ncbi:MAG: hypothetical protein WCJ76_08290 [Comamonadaceae bacterium]